VAVTSEKLSIVSELKVKLSSSKGAVLTNYRGLTVAQDTQLRRNLREAGVNYHVVKNTMTRIAAQELGIEGLDVYLEGPTALALSNTDPVAPARVISNFIKDNKLKVMEIKAGLLDGQVIDAQSVKALADLPSRDVLLAQVLAGMQTPIVGIVNVLQGSIRKVVYALEAVRKQKELA